MSSCSLSCSLSGQSTGLEEENNLLQGWPDHVFYPYYDRIKRYRDTFALKKTYQYPLLVEKFLSQCEIYIYIYGLYISELNKTKLDVSIDGSTQRLVAPPVAEAGATPSFTFESFVRTPDSWGSLPWPIKAVFFAFFFLPKRGVKCFLNNVKKTSLWVGQGRQSPSIGLILTFHFRFLFSKLPCICIVVHCWIVVVLMNQNYRPIADPFSDFLENIKMGHKLWTSRWWDTSQLWLCTFQSIVGKNSLSEAERLHIIKCNDFSQPQPACLQCHVNTFDFPIPKLEKNSIMKTRHSRHPSDCCQALPVPQS